MFAMSWKVIVWVLFVAAADAEPSRALSVVYSRPNPMFIPRNYRRRQTRVLFLDEDESQQYGRGEIDLTKYDPKIKFDDAPDYEFTSPEESKMEDLPSGNERFYEPLPRLRTPQLQNFPKFYQGRFGRPYAPNYGFDFAPYAPALRASFYNGWKARSPRVVFPYAPDAVQTNSHAGPGGPSLPGGSVDNVVFREQNFGLNEVSGDDLTLQDIGTGNADAFAERDAKPHRALDTNMAYKKRPLSLTKPMFVQTEVRPSKRTDYYTYPNTTLPQFKPISDAQMHRITQIIRDSKTKKENKSRRGKYLDNSIESTIDVNDLQKEDRQDEKKCAQGGTCEFFIYCWMVGGLLDGTCGGLLKGCCHRVAKAGILGVHDSNSIEYSPNEGLSYGPVINDESK